MKATPTWTTPSAALLKYRQDNPADAAHAADQGPAAWKRFRDQAPAAYTDVLSGLITAQQGLCAYCEQGLTWSAEELEHASRNGRDLGQAGERVPLDSQVEHVRAKSSGPGLALDPSNLIACCNGGTARHLELLSERFQRPDAKSRSCGQSKEDGGCRIDPRALPLAPSLMRVGIEGDLYPDPGGCAVAGLAEAEVEHAINEVLRLNSPRLMAARKARKKQAEESIEWLSVLARDLRAQDALLRGWLETLAAERLAPDSQGHLRPFWSVWRQVLAPFSEDWVRANAPRLNFAGASP